MSNAIIIDSLCKSFRVGLRMKNIQAVSNLNLTVNEGEIYGFIGPNGAGKTTTIKILMGLGYPTSGSVKIFGKPAQDVETKALVGFLPERPYFYEYLTAAEFLDFYGRLFGISKDTRLKRIEALLERVSLTPHRNTQLRKFSKGMLQRVGLAQALINEPRLVVLDEPMSGLDPLGRMLIRDLIVELKKQGKTVFFSTHILSDVELICDRVGIIIGGQRKEEGTLDELLSHKTNLIELVLKPQANAMDKMIEVLSPVAILVEKQGELLQIKVRDKAAKKVVFDTAIATGAEIESIVNRRESLEELFMEELIAVKKGASSVGKDW